MAGFHGVFPRRGLSTYASKVRKAPSVTTQIRSSCLKPAGGRYERTNARRGEGKDSLREEWDAWTWARAQRAAADGITAWFEETVMAAERGTGGNTGGIGLGGILVIVGIVLMIVWSFWVGLIVTLVGLIAFGGFAKGKWY